MVLIALECLLLAFATAWMLGAFVLPGRPWVIRVLLFSILVGLLLMRDRTQ